MHFHRHTSLFYKITASWCVHNSKTRQGSTGQPKGVAVSHGNLAHSTLARDTYYRSPVESFLLTSSFAFDSSAAGIFWTLATGGRLVLPENKAEKDVSLLLEMIDRNRISHFLSIPSFYKQILTLAKPEQIESVRVVIAAGEACTSGLAELHYRSLPGAMLFNEYGPTEATVWCSVYSCPDKEIPNTIPIGCPISNTRMYILDSSMNPVPIGIPGELYIGGEGLAYGYFRAPKLTAERFFSDPISTKPGERIYKTGDRARYLPDGNVEFLGRVDHQVKIRGFRIEISNFRLENCMAQKP